MADSDVQITFGASTEGAIAGIGEIEAAIAQLSAQVKANGAVINEATDSSAAALQHFTNNVGIAFGGVEINAREASEGFRTALEAMRGETQMAITSFLRLAISFGASNPELVALGAAALAAAGGFAYLAYEAYEWVQAVEKVELGNIINQVSMTREEIDAYVADIEKAANVSATDAQKIIQSFQGLGEAGQPIAELTAKYIPLLEEMGVKAPEAANQLAKYFSDLDGAGAKLVNSVNDTTGALRAEFAAAQQAGNINRQYALIVQALADKYGAATSALAEMKAPMSDFQDMVRLGGAESAGLALALESDSEAAQKTADSIKRASDEMQRWNKALADADMSGQRFAQGAALVESLDKTDAGIEKTKGRLAELTDYLNALKLKQSTGVGGDQSAEIDKTTAAIKLETTALAELNEKKNDPAGQARFALEIAQAGENSAKKIAILKEEYQQKVAIYGADSAQAVEAMTRIVEAQNAAAKSAVKPVAEQFQAMVADAEKAYSTVKALADDSFKETEEKLKAEASQHQITYIQETQGLLAALDQRLSAETAALGQRYVAEYQALSGEMAQYAQGTSQWQAALRKRNEAYQQYQDDLSKLDSKANLDRQKIDDDAVKTYTTQWTSALNTIESSFNSQLRGLLAGTTTWNQAWHKMIGDMIIKFIEMCEEMVVKWAAAQLAQTTAATTGAAASAAAQESASGAGILAAAANAVRIIMQDAGQAFAGVFAFLAPTMGPAAAGPAAAAQASVSAAAIFDAGTPEILRSGLAVVHQGESIVPAWARGSGPWTGGAGGRMDKPTVHAPVSINVSALDSQSVSRFFNDNSKHMMRAINDAVKRGAHLGLARASR